MMRSFSSRQLEENLSDFDPSSGSFPLPVSPVGQAEELGQLLACAAAGSHSCFEALYDELAPLVFALTLKILCNRAHAEEVTQEIFLEVWQKAPLFNPAKGSVKNWVLTISRRRAVDRVRATQSALNRDLTEGAKGFSETYSPVDEVIEARSDIESVERALAGIHHHQATVVRLAYFRGMTQQEIATYLDIPLGTVKSRMRLALSNLRLVLGGHP